MKTLLLLRHAKAEPEGHTGDHDRKLTERGIRDSHAVAERFVELRLQPDVVVSSTAMRTRMTTELVADRLRFDGTIQFTSDLYLAPPASIVSSLRRLASDCKTVLVVGHNPGLEDLLSELTGRFEHLSTAAFARIELSIRDWQELEADKSARLRTLISPGEVMFIDG